MRSMREPGREGYVLITVLAVMMLIASLVVATSLFARSAVTSTTVDQDALVADGLLDAGLEMAAYKAVLVNSADASPPEHLHLKLNTGTVDQHIIDESGKIDLNGADPQLLAGLFKGLGMGQGDIDAVLREVTAIRGDGASSKGPPTNAPQPPGALPGAQGRPRRGFQSVGDLATFPEVTARDMMAIGPVLTVYNPGGKINIKAASPSVLSAIPDLSEASVSEILQKRAGASKEDLAGLIGAGKSSLTAEPGGAFTIIVTATTNSGLRRSTHAVIARSSGDRVPYYVVARWD